MLAVPKRLQRDLGAGSMTRSRRPALDLVGVAEEERVVCDHRLSGASRRPRGPTVVATVLSSNPAYS